MNYDVKIFRLLIVSALGLSTVAATLQAEEGKKRPRGARLFYRMVDSQNNAPVLPKTESAWTQDKDAHVGNTGMADEGVTEYPFCYGVMDFTFVEYCAIYPRFISGAQADEARTNVADMVIDHVYQPDATVWGYNAKEFVQTFTATQNELVSITLLVASKSGEFRAALVEGGPSGKQVGPTKTFTSGQSMEWGTARWTAGQAPMVPGQTYGIRMWREDGEAWTPFLHSTGNLYDGGLLYVDGKPVPASDMAMMIVEEPADMKRSIIEGADEEGWVYNQMAATFIPRTPNVRLIELKITPSPLHCCAMIMRVKDASGKVICGPKWGVTCGPKNGVHSAPFVFANDELPVTIGERYSIEAFTVTFVEHQAPELPSNDEPAQGPFDFNVRVYGEPDPGTLPGMFNLTGTFVTDSKLKLDWSEPFPCATTVEVWGNGPTGGKTFEVPAGTSEILLEKLWAGHEYKFKLTKVGPTGLVWNTPLYQVNMPHFKDKKEGVLHSSTYVLKEFLPLAELPLASPQKYSPLRYKAEVELVNGGFEDGLNGWKAEPADIVKTPDFSWGSKSVEAKAGLGTNWGASAAGIAAFADEDRQQVFEKSAITQSIKTTPGNTYVISGWINTTIANAPNGAPRGDTRARFYADPTGGNDFEGLNASQWYFTDGKWMRFQHEFIAEADNATIGFGFFRWRDLDIAAAFVDNVHVFDLGPAPAALDAPALRSPKEPRTRVLIDPKVEIDEKVEAQVTCPTGYVMTGLGARAHEDNITTMWAKIQPLMSDGTLGEAEYIRDGYQPASHLEAQVELPDGYVVTGFGAGIAPEWDVKRFYVWARPLNKDGSLGEEKEFQGGADQESGPEKKVRLEAGRVITTAGLNCNFNDVNRIKGSSAVLVPTAEAAARAAAKAAAK